MTRITGQYLEGNEDGAWKTYHDDGTMEMIIKYQFGRSQGDSHQWLLRRNIYGW